MTAINKPIHLVVGGTHLLPAKDDQIKAIATSLHDTWKVNFLAPTHCTGEPAFAALKQTFGDRYLYAGLGTTIVLGPKVTVKAEAGQPDSYAMDAEDLRTYREAMAAGPLRALLGGYARLARAARRKAARSRGSRASNAIPGVPLAGATSCSRSSGALRSEPRRPTGCGTRTPVTRSTAARRSRSCCRRSATPI
jgi:hypothetical protein